MLWWSLGETQDKGTEREGTCTFDSTSVLCPPCKGIWLPLPWRQTISHSCWQEWKPFLEPPKNLRAVSKAAAAAPTPLWLFPFSLPHLSACSSPPVHLPQAVKICLVHLWPPQKKSFCTLHASPILLHNICSCWAVLLSGRLIKYLILTTAMTDMAIWITLSCFRQLW